MKKLSCRIVLVFASAFLIAGCVKNSDFEALQSRVDSLESDKIASIEALISSINASVTSLEGTDVSLQNYITELNKQVAELKTTDGTQADEIAGLQSKITELEAAIARLEAKDTELQNQITSLKTYAEKLVSDSKTWANATFATLEQYNASAKTISEIQETLTAIDGKITATVETATAHTTLLENIQSTISAMQLDIDTLKNEVSSLLSRVQSITYVPKYSDGKVSVTYIKDGATITPGIAEFDFKVKPDNFAADIATLWAADKSILSMTAFYAVTKAVPDEVALEITAVTAENGYLSIIASAKGLDDYDFYNGNISASACLNLSDGNNDLTTSTYINLIPQCVTPVSITFEDTTFKNYCLQNFDIDSDGRFTDYELERVTQMDCSEYDFTSLVGIEYFTKLESLNCSGNTLESLDVSALTALTSLDVTGNESLASLTTSGTPFSSLKASAQFVGKAVTCNGVTGVVIKVGADYVRIVSGDETKASYADGESWATGLGSGWEVATTGDFQTLYPRKSDINETLSSLGCSQITGDYWINAKDGVYMLDIEKCVSWPSTHTRIYKIRAARNL